LYINIVSDAINAVNLLDACSVKPLCKGFCVGDSCFSNRSLMTDSEICSITNQIFEELNIPDTLKRGIITPVLKKKKDKTLPGNYRGIVVTNTFSKIIESVIKERLEKQLSPTRCVFSKTSL
jgi:hypothetical protein